MLLFEGGPDNGRFSEPSCHYSQGWHNVAAEALCAQQTADEETSGPGLRLQSVSALDRPLCLERPLAASAGAV